MTKMKGMKNFRKYRKYKKYLEVFRMSFKMQIVWRFDVAMTAVAVVTRVAAAWLLWSAVYMGRDMVGGFTFEAMLSYYIVSSIIGSIDFSNQVSGEVSQLIRDGGFSKHMVTPINPIGFFGAIVGGESAYHLGFSLLAAALCAVMFHQGINLTADVSRILPAIVMMLLGLAFMVGYHFFVGVMTFQFMNIEFFLILQGDVIRFATGSLIPLSLLPGSVAAALKFLPFTHVVYTPAMLLAGQMSAREGMFGLCVIAAWAVGMLTVAWQAYGRLRVRYDGVGI